MVYKMVKLKLDYNLNQKKMNKEFVPYDIALALKELGFKKHCLKYYFEDKMLCRGFALMNWNKQNGCLNAPLYQQAFRWFREKYDLNYVIVKAESWFYTINGCNTQEGFNTYEEAELACLRKLIEIVNQNKDE